MEGDASEGGDEEDHRRQAQGSEEKRGERDEGQQEAGKGGGKGPSLARCRAEDPGAPDRSL